MINSLAKKHWFPFIFGPGDAINKHMFLRGVGGARGGGIGRLRSGWPDVFDPCFFVGGETNSLPLKI